MKKPKFVGSAVNILLLLLFAFGSTGLSVLLPAPTASAAGGGETVKWNTPYDITFSGGRLAASVTWHLKTGEINTPRLVVNATIKDKDSNSTMFSDTQCYLTTGFAGVDVAKNTVTLGSYFPPPPVTTNPDDPPPAGSVIGGCYEDDTIGGKGVYTYYENAVYTMSNARPTEGDSAPETAAQQVVSINAYNYLKSSVPATIAVTMKMGDKTKTGTLTLQADDDTSYRKYTGSVRGVEPGTWSLCGTVASKTECRTVTKIKYRPGVGSLDFGTPPETADDRMIKGSLIIDTSHGDSLFTPDNLDEDIDYGTFNLSLIEAGEGGKTLQKTDVHVVYDGEPCRLTMEDDDGWHCTSPPSVSEQYSFKNVAAGKYKICVTGTDKCINVTKVRSDDLTDADIKLSFDEATEFGTGISGSQEPVCAAGSLGWVICPAIDLMQQATTKVAELLGSVLRINPLRTSGSDSIYGVWSSILNVANIMLVIAFLMVVFSQATSYGLSNYGIKRMLPRIIAAAILMNISFFICQVLVDISNILGAGAAEFVSAASGNSFADNVREQSSTISQVIVGGAIIAIIAFFFLIPTLLAVLAVFFTIAARNAIIILLVMVAPLAFAAWILPNTEKYFQKWWGLLVNMLMLYPMVMFIFAASVVAANAISTAGNNSELQSIIALLVMAMPLFALPFLFKAAGGVLGKINDMTKRSGAQGVQGYGKAKGAYDNSKFGKYREQKKEQLRGQELAGTYGGRNKLRSWRGKASRSIYGSRVSGGYGSSILDAANQQREQLTERASTYASRNPVLARAMMRYAETGDLKKAQAYEGPEGETLDLAAQQQLGQMARQGIISPGASAARVAASGLAQGGKLTIADIRTAEKVVLDSKSLSRDEQQRQLGQMAGDIIGGSGKSGMVQHGNWGVADGRLKQEALGKIKDDFVKKSFADISYNSFRAGTGGQEALNDLVATNDNYRASAVAALRDGRVNDRVKDHIRAALTAGSFPIPVGTTPTPPSPGPDIGPEPS